MLAIIAWGGVGKTALLAEWLHTRFFAGNFTGNAQGATGAHAPAAYFDWSFYDQGTAPTEDPTAARVGSVGDFFERALAHFGDPDPTRPGKGRRLATLVQRRRTLFVLDGLEPLQQPPGSPQAGQLLDPDLRDLIQALAQVNPGLLLITSRQTLPDLDGLTAANRQRHLEDLAPATAVRLLRELEVTGTDAELADACARFGCHALSLTLLGRFLCDAHGGDVRCIDRVDLHRADEATRAERHRTAWKVLAADEDWLRPPADAPSGLGGRLARAWRRRPWADRGRPASLAEALARRQTLAVLRLTGLFDRTADPGCLAVLRRRPVIRGLTDALVGLDETGWRLLLGRLERARLIRLRPDAEGAPGIDAHPLIRDYFAEQLRLYEAAAFAAAHGRLFEHLCTSTPYRPDDLEGLQPLYQAVRHGCLAGRQQDACDKVYFDRILRGAGDDGFYSWKKLGAISANLGAVAAFFDETWGCVSPKLTEPDRAWLLSEAAFSLRALGRLTEALAPMRVASEIEVQAERWKRAAVSYSNLSELEVTLGRLSDAVLDANAGVAHADRSGDEFERMGNRTTAADALHQSGEYAEAGRLLDEAERMQQERQPQLPLLYALQGFRYCDWILAPTERAAWRVLLGGAGLQRSTRPADCQPAGKSPAPACPPRAGITTAAESDTLTPTEPLAVCGEVERRATTTLGWGQHYGGSLLSIALGHLTVARARLLRALLTGPLPPEALQSDALAAAVTGLREAGAMDELPRALLTAAWYHALTGNPDAARAALDEALQIAERGPMPLFAADVLLYRARLWWARPWAAAPAPTLGAASGPDTPPDPAPAAYPWPDGPHPGSPVADLAQARRLIESHGYRRRLPELEDAEVALRGL